MARRGGDDGGGGDGRRRGNAAVVDRVSTGTLRHLPRTTRWRVQLGLLDLPAPPPPGAADEGASESDWRPSPNRDPLSGDRDGDGGGGDGLTGSKTAADDGRSPAPAIESAVFTEDEIYESSASKLAQQRDRFDRLARDHMWRNSPLDLIEQEQKNDPPPGTEEEESSKPKETSLQTLAPAPAPVVDDPLSAFVREREEAERAEAAAAEEEAARGRAVEEGRETHNNGEGGRRSSQWTGFYSNREVIDLINKDLHRLSPRLVLPPQPRNTKIPSRTSSAGGLSSFCASSSDDEDDLDDDESARMGRDFRKLAGPAWERRREDRLRLLSDVLFLYSMEHPDVGYRQGMHEVLAHVVLALEMDMMNATDDDGGRRGGGANAAAGVDAGGDFVVVPRLHRTSSSASASSSSPHTAAAADLRMDAYLLFEAWMDHLKPAYMDDHASRSGSKGGGGGNAAAIGDRVLDLLRHESPQVHFVISDISTRMGAPPQLYLVGWMRLVFGRVFSDVAGTLDMWDCLLDLLADPPRWSDEEEVGGEGNGDGGGQRDDDSPPRRLSLMDILECAACGMILLQAPSLLSDGGGGGDDFDDPDDDGGVSSTMRMHDRLSLLMNYPTLSDVAELRDLTVITARDRLERRSRRWRRRRARRRGDGRSSPPDTSPAAVAVPGEISVDARVAASAAAAAAISSGVHHQRTQPTAPPLGAVVVGCPEDDRRPRSSQPPWNGVNRRPPQPPPERHGHHGQDVAGTGTGTGADRRRNGQRQRQRQQQQQQQQHWDSGVALSSRVGEALDRTVVSCRGFIAKAEGRISQEIANMEGRIKSHEAAAGNASSPPVPHQSSTSPITGNVSVGYFQGGDHNSASSPLGDGVASSALSPHETATAKKDEQQQQQQQQQQQPQQQQQRRQDEMQRSKLRERLRDISNGMDDGLREIRDHLMLLSNRPGSGGTGRSLENGGAGSSSDSLNTGGNIDSSSTTAAFETIPLHPSESQQQRPPGEGVLEALRRLEALQRELASLGEEL